MNIDTIVGLYLGEGHFSVSKYQRKNKSWQFSAEIGFSNSDAALIDYVCTWLESVGVHHYIRQNAQGCYQVVVQHYTDVLVLVETLEPLLFGNKKAEAALLRRFVLHRLRPKSTGETKLGNNQHNPYTEEDHRIVDEARLRKSSTTKSIPVCTERHGYNGTEYVPPQSVMFNDTTHKWNAVQ